MATTERRWSYFNVLEALFSNLPSDTYKADVGVWSKAVWKLREQYEAEYPDLFSDIHFVENEPGLPYSRQISDFFVYQSFGGMRDVMNPAYEDMPIPEGVPAELRKRNPHLLETYPVLETMAKAVEQNLKKS